jgi:hypothetical protein
MHKTDRNSIKRHVPHVLALFYATLVPRSRYSTNLYTEKAQAWMEKTVGEDKADNTFLYLLRD